jgi:hypothetical protein
MAETYLAISENYPLPVGCNGIYYVTLGGNEKWFNDDPEKFGWLYDEANKILSFVEGTDIPIGTNNLLIYYFETQTIENVVADLLVKAGFYANRAAALVAMDYVATGITVGKIWFDAGSNCLKAIGMICERCNYRFYFKWDGTPVFRPEPSIEDEGDEDFAFRHCDISEVDQYQDRNEIRNKIIIEGLKQTYQIAKQENMESELKGSAEDATSISAYGEHSYSINNYLFQTQAGIDSFCAAYLSLYKDPKWYAGFKAPVNPIPLEKGDTVRWQVRLSPPSGNGKKYGTFKYGDGTKYASNGIVIVQRGLIRDIKIDNSDVTYLCEKET